MIAVTVFPKSSSPCYAVDMIIRIILAAALLAGCSTVSSRRDNPPIFDQTTRVSLAAFQGCFGDRTAAQQVNYVPRTNGGSFSAGAGPQRYVFWVVDIDDLGTGRRIRVYAVNGAVARKDAIPSVLACM